MTIDGCTNCGHLAAHHHDTRCLGWTWNTIGCDCNRYSEHVIGVAV